MGHKKNEQEKKLVEENKAAGGDPKKTPYQGKRRCFGFFKCTKCKRQWASAASWANAWQKCFSCNTAIYPRKQLKLKRKPKPKVTDVPLEKKPHLEELCEKCRVVGFCCLQIKEEKGSGERLLEI